MSKKKNVKKGKPRNSSSSFFRNPIFQVGAILVVALIVYLIATTRGGSAAASEVTVDQAYEMYQSGTFTLDVRTQEEWDEYHAPNTTLIPLDELEARISELPKDQEILVICRSGNRSQQGRDILLAAGFNATSMTGGLKEWSAKGYPLEGTRP